MELKYGILEYLCFITKLKITKKNQIIINQTLLFLTKKL